MYINCKKKKKRKNYYTEFCGVICILTTRHNAKSTKRNARNYICHCCMFDKAEMRNEDTTKLKQKFLYRFAIYFTMANYKKR